jgi:hypothetical protein
LDLDTPPAPVVLHVSPVALSWSDDNINNVHDLFLQWSVPDDSSKWLARIVVERRKDGGAWRSLNTGFGPTVSPLEVGPDIGHLYEYRLRWGPTMTEYSGGTRALSFRRGP